ncbi:NAD(+) kinase, partial [Burkholderia cenocepacia]|nr:NAD(+) kinase [Burkholderia cenocepacia]
MREDLAWWKILAQPRDRGEYRPPPLRGAARSGPVGAQPVLFVNELWCNAGMKTGNQFNTVALVGRSNTPGIAEPLATLADSIATLGFEVVFEGDTAREIGIAGYPALTPAEIGARADVA